MKAVQLLTAALAVVFAGFALADDKKPDEKKAAFDATKLEGKWKLTDGKKNGAGVGDDSKKSVFVFSKDTIKIMAGDNALFTIKYTVDAKASPVTIDMEISEGEGGKGMKAKGILELKDDELKLCYDPMGGDRPAKFDGDKAYFFTFKKEKEEKKDK